MEKGNIDIYLKSNDNIIKSSLIEDSKLSILMINKMIESSKKINIREFGDEEVTSENFMPLFVIDYTEGFEDELARLDGRFRFYKLSDDFGIVYINRNRIEDLGEIYRFESLYRVQRYVKMDQLTTLSRGITNGYVATEEIGANFFKDNPNISIDGRGVIIGISILG